MPVMSRKPRPTFAAEYALWQAGHRAIVGVDEVGVGTVAGPLVAAAVLLPSFSETNVVSEMEALAQSWWEVRDSKDIADLKKVRLDVLIRQSVSVGVGIVDVEERATVRNPDTHTRLATERALYDLSVPFDSVLLDGLVDLPNRKGIYQRVFKENEATTSLSISAASIVANVYFNDLMRAYGETYPEYGFAQHKGYMTPQHREALLLHGICPIHHKNNKEVKRILAKRL